MRNSAELFKLTGQKISTKELDQSSVHLYADDTEITCKSSVNDLGVIITNNLKWDSHIDERLSKAQRKHFFLKRNVPFSTITRVKVSLHKKLHFIDSTLRQMYGSRIGQPAEN